MWRAHPGVGGLRALFGGSFPIITVTLSPDIPLALYGKSGKGVAEVELGGAWMQDAQVRIVQSMGGGELRLPDDVEIEGLPAFRGSTSSSELPVPKLSMSVSSSFGNLAIVP